MQTISPKVLASTIGAAVVTILIALASLAGYEPTLELSGAVYIIVVFLLGYFRIDPTRKV
jgi:energy-converting hydrogenase Eha subunit B